MCCLHYHVRCGVVDRTIRLYTVNERRRPTYRWGICTTIQDKIFHQLTPSEGRFPTYRLMMFIENIPSFRLDFSCRRCRGQIFGNALYSIASDWGCVPRFSTKSRSELSQDVHVQTGIYLRIMHENAAPHFLHVVWEFLSAVFPEQQIG